MGDGESRVHEFAVLAMCTTFAATVRFNTFDDDDILTDPRSEKISGFDPTSTWSLYGTEISPRSRDV